MTGESEVRGGNDRKPFLVDEAGTCMDCDERPARIAAPGPGGSTWLLCIACSERRLTEDMPALIAQIEDEHSGRASAPNEEKP